MRRLRITRAVGAIILAGACGSAPAAASPSPPPSHEFVTHRLGPSAVSATRAPSLRALDAPAAGSGAADRGGPRPTGPVRTTSDGRVSSARLRYGGPQPAFPIGSEGYWPLGNYDPTVGRLYMPERSTVTLCTATLVAPNVLLTAAHCVWNLRTRRYYPASSFVPDQRGASHPYGTWRGARTWMLRGFQQQPTVAQDYAFVVTAPRRGVQPGEVVGWHGLLANSTADTALTTGYPGSGVFARRCTLSSCYQWFCRSRIGARRTGPVGTEVGIGCNSGHGSSGGPWFEPYRGAFYVASDTSTGVGRRSQPYTTNEWGPYFDARTLGLYQRARRG